MKSLCFAAGAALLACGVTSPGQAKTACGPTLNAPLHANAALTIASSPAGLEVVGTDTDTLRVTCTTGDQERGREVHLRYSGGADGGKLSIDTSAPHHGDLEFRIEVPRRTNLRIHMGAGQVTVEEVSGDKAISLYAGQITISGSHGWDYRRIEASVDIGEVNAQAFGADKGGFFRTFTHKTDDGEYRLYAHVVTGQIDLVGNGGTAE
ncbi:MAG TPA: hypothetical protein VMD92_16300 [Acidobacteriaceae bacterium]|jgi:hypothetical protein|nr:hypothetical protein [Acidobacteriaceae bacterium]